MKLDFVLATSHAAGARHTVILHAFGPHHWLISGAYLDTAKQQSFFHCVAYICSAVAGCKRITAAILRNKYLEHCQHDLCSAACSDVCWLVASANHSDIAVSCQFAVLLVQWLMH